MSLKMDTKQLANRHDALFSALRIFFSPQRQKPILDHPTTTCRPHEITVSHHRDKKSHHRENEK